MDLDDETSGSDSDGEEDSAETIAEPDGVEVEAEQSDTLSDDDDGVLYQLNDVSPFLARNPDVKWERFPLDSRKTRTVNKMTGQPGVTPSARSRVVTLMDTFNPFFTPQVKDLIIRFANEEGRTQYGDGWVKLDSVMLTWEFYFYRG
ncbi:hypothetical protein RvY_18169 [Ramazzottius varieornatus]|uniref:PiggyBac transposable element-derived protein domain-containing protein n=1 Tax=Ramazzottius varieornatus TaxID=947166 RepID=A0A1D1W4S6_RAMVA|nr:hypothetical protein RvY_18169 [Ramazzottius varieornatus]